MGAPAGHPLLPTALCISLQDSNAIKVSISIYLSLAVYLLPPRIVSYPHFNDQSAFTNEQVILTVTFQSHQEAVSWFKNGIPISSNNITTQYGPANATTELRFEQITRENRGSYQVEIENTAEVIQIDMRTAVATFNVDVQGKMG